MQKYIIPIIKLKYFKQFTQMWEIAPKNTCVAMATQVVIYYWLNLCFKIYYSQYLFTAIFYSLAHLPAFPI